MLFGATLDFYGPACILALALLDVTIVYPRICAIKVMMYSSLFCCA
jgi:hypothetical protein